MMTTTTETTREAPEALRHSVAPSTVDSMAFAEAVSWVAGGLGDVCPVLLDFGARWANEMRSDTERCQLLQYVERLIGTAASAEVARRRRDLHDRWLIYQYAPAWLDLAGYVEHASALRSMQETDVNATRAVLELGQNPAAMPPSFHENPVLVVAHAVARQATHACGWSHGSVNSVDARNAMMAAGHAARVYAYDAAQTDTAGVQNDDRWEMIFDALEPTVSTLQASAHGLFEQMIRQGESG